MQSAIQLRPLGFESAEARYAAASKEEATQANRPDIIAELESYLKDAAKLEPRRDWRSWRARLQVLAESI